MKKLIPILTIVCAVVTAFIAVTGIIAVSIATRVNGIALLAVPAAIIGLVLSALGGALAFLFRKDTLCKISVIIYAAALVVSISAVTVWLAVL